MLDKYYNRHVEAYLSETFLLDMESLYRPFLVEELVALARYNTCLAVQQCTFFEFSIEPQSVHGIWACASLLHLPYEQIPAVLINFSRFLIPGGVIYYSFKYGDEQVVPNGRCFTDMNEARLKAVVGETKLAVDEIWLSEDLRPERKG